MTEEFKKKLTDFVSSLPILPEEKEEFLGALANDVGPELLADFGDLVEKAIVALEDEYQGKIDILKKEMDTKIADVEKKLQELKDEGKKIIKDISVAKDQKDMEDVRQKIGGM